MNPFDLYLRLVHAYIGDLRERGRKVCVWLATPSCNDRKHSAPGGSLFVLKENTAIELGGPLTAGTTFQLWTTDNSLVSHGRITIIGPDIPEAKEKTIPFGQVTMVSGTAIAGDIEPRLETETCAAARIPGYMARSTGGKIWCRVSHQARDKGFSLRVLGDALVDRIRTKVPEISCVEVLFVTSSIEDVENLDRIGAQVRKLSHDLRRERLKQASDGSFVCESSLSCDICPDSKVCAEIRQILVVRKKRAKGKEPFKVEGAFDHLKRN